MDKLFISIFIWRSATAIAFLLAPAHASLLTDDVAFSHVASGINFNQRTSTATVTDPGREFTFCVFTDLENACSSTGMFGEINISSDSLTIRFVGSTRSAPGSDFQFTISDLDWLNMPDSQINAVTLSSGSISSTINFEFGISGFTADSITFAGSPREFNNSYSAIGGGGPLEYTISTFNQNSIPVPNILLLFAIGLFSAVLRQIRKS